MVIFYYFLFIFYYFMLFRPFEHCHPVL